MPALKIAVQLSAVQQPFRKALSTAARLGATGVEIDARGELRPGELSQTGLREVRRLVEEHGMRVVAVSFHTRRGYDNPHEIDRRVAATKAAMSFAADLRAPIVINQVGQVGDDGEGPGWTLLVQTLTELIAHGQRVGVIFAAVTGSESGPNLAKLVDILPAPGIGIDLDPGNLILNGFSPLEAVGALGKGILNVHAHDGVRDLARGRGIDVPLGRGSADFPALLAALEAQPYRGYFTVVRGSDEDPQTEIEQAISYLRSL
jgi:sugar phosphate isomerase/epimerase